MRDRTPPGRSAAASKPDAGGLAYDYVAERAKRWLGDDLRRTRAGLARIAGLRVDQVHELLNGERKPTQRAMRALARAVGVDFDEVESSAATWAQSSDRRPEVLAPTVSGSPARRGSRPNAEKKSAPGVDPVTTNDRYPNRARAVQAALLLAHDARDIETVLAVVLPPGTNDPEPRAWISWIDRAREERLQSPVRRPRQRRTP